ncbi:AIPR family protein [Ruminococcus sp.]|uniref:AIPR family protein n=1 Tax=Ruminococcus sp. TaxID=41978 RepID=UPI0035214D16
MSTELNFKVESFRKIPNPFQNKDLVKKPDEFYPQMYFAICDVKDLPDNIPMATNPREQKMGTSVAKKIMESLLKTSEPDFYLLNRGLVISAKDVHYDNNSGMLKVIFQDLDVHGNIDGGHTYKAILKKREQIDYGQQFVKIELLTGVEDIFQSLAAARNTSTQVQDKSIAELENRFKFIKDAIRNEPFKDNVYFRENDKGDIDVADIISILTLFNISKYPDQNSFPIVSYNGKKKCIDYYIDDHKKYGETVKNPYYRLKNIMTDLFKLYDMIETKMVDYYKQKYTSGRYGSVKGVTSAKRDTKFKSKFYKKEMDYQTPTGFLYPILGSFRALIVQDDNGYYKWAANPFDFLDRLGSELVETTIERSRTLGNSPQAVGKDSGNWKTLYITVELELRRSL